MNLGIKVGIAEMLQAAEEPQGRRHRHERPAGQVHPHHAGEPRGAERAAAWPTSRCILGGAALTRTYVERDLRQVYEGRLFYGKDAFEGLRTMDRLVELQRRPARTTPTFGREPGRSQAAARASRQHGAVDGRSRRPPRSPEVAADNPVFTPPFLGSAGWPRASPSTTSPPTST